MKTLKLHSYAVRLAYKHKEVYILCDGPDVGRAIYEHLMPMWAPTFNIEAAGWVNVNMTKAEPPQP